MTITHFEAVLLKPLDQQADRDGSLIDPAGVRFDPDATYPIFREFNYSVPDDVVGSGRVSRAPDGALVVSGVLLIDVNAQIEEGRFPYSLAIGISTDFESGKLPTIPKSDLTSIGFTAKHIDPTQPTINIIRRDKMNLVRLGHYFNPGNDACQTALVVKVVEQATNGINSRVNLVVWDGDGDDDKRLDVQENTNPTTADTEATFHLANNCPWGR
jgi:hypothetical protein